MTQFRAAVREIGQRRRYMRPALTCYLAEEVSAIPGFDGEVTTTPEDLGSLQRRLLDSYKRKGLSGFSLSELRSIPEGLWHGPQPLDEVGSFFDEFVERLRNERRTSVVRRFIEAFLSRYPLGARTFSHAADLISSEIVQSGSRYLELSRSWRGFDKSDGTSRLATEFLARGPVVLEDAGLSEERWSFQFVEAVFCEICRRLDPFSFDELGYLQALAARSSGPRSEIQRYPASRGILMEALLGRFISKSPPTSRQKKAIMDLIDRVAGDPRSFPDQWIGVDDALKKTYLRWLASASLRQFFDIVERSLSTHENGLRMWPERRRFWTAWVDRGHVEEAWVAFGPSALQVAQRATRDDPSFGSSYGKVEPYRTSFHSALIMKFGDHIVVEWSHTGRCWIWPDGKGAPATGDSTYPADELREAPIGVVHSEGWQGRINEHIYALTKKRLPPSQLS